MENLQVESRTAVPANGVFSSPITRLFFNAVHFDENPFPCQCKKEDKKAQSFQISHFHWSFTGDTMAGYGLKTG